MADLNDACADCGHLRHEHGGAALPGQIYLGCRRLKLNASEDCPCPAFDEGVPIPQNYGFPWRVADPVTEGEGSGVWVVLDRYGAVVLRTKAKGVADLVVEMANARNGQSRIEAAERAVVEAAGSSMEKWVNSGGPNWLRDPGIVAIRDALSRLRSLMEQAGAEECGEVIEVQTHNVVRGIGGTILNVTNVSRTGPIECHLPRGHGGEHEGELGAWRWR